MLVLNVAITSNPVKPYISSIISSKTNRYVKKYVKPKSKLLLT